MAETYQVSVKRIRMKKAGKRGGRTDTYVVIKTPDGTIGLNTNVRTGVPFYQLPGKEKKISARELGKQARIAKGVLEREGEAGVIERYKLSKDEMINIAKGLRMAYEPKKLFAKKRKAKA